MSRLARAAAWALLWAAWACLWACSASEGRAKLRILDEILASRNDNDPRLDTQFNGLSPGTKRLFREKYRSTPPERRNSRGTIVYLLGRNLTAPEDWAFLKEAACEPPCLSLADCSKKGESGAHAGIGDEVTLAYPSLVALTQAQRALEADPKGPAAAQARAVLGAARASKTPAVARLAEKLLAGDKSP